MIYLALPKPKSSKKKRNPAVNAKASCITDVDSGDFKAQERTREENEKVRERGRGKNGKRKPKTSDKRVTSKNSY